MVWSVMVAAEFVVVSVAVLACFAGKFVPTWLKKPHPGFSQHPRFDFIARRAKVQYQIQQCVRQPEGKTRLRRRILSGGRYDTGR